MSIAHTCVPFPPSYLYLHHAFHTTYLSLNIFDSFNTIIPINLYHIFTCTITSIVFLCLLPILFICAHYLHCYLHSLPTLLPAPITYTSTYSIICYLHLPHLFANYLSNHFCITYLLDPYSLYFYQVFQL